MTKRSRYYDKKGVHHISTTPSILTSLCRQQHTAASPPSDRVFTCVWLRRNPGGHDDWAHVTSQWDHQVSSPLPSVFGSGTVYRIGSAFDYTTHGLNRNVCEIILLHPMGDSCRAADSSPRMGSRVYSGINGQIKDQTRQGRKMIEVSGSRRAESRRCSSSNGTRAHTRIIGLDGN